MPQTNKLVVASAGIISVAPGFSASFTVSWGANISQFRLTRIWPGVVGASDEASHQTMTIVSEASRWDAFPDRHTLAVTLRADGDQGFPVQARLQVMSSAEDTF
jgi:hypothetical protein